MVRKEKIETKFQATGRMVQLAAEATALATVLAERDEAIAAVNERFADKIETGAKAVLALKAELKEWAKANRKEAGDGKTIRFEGVGEIVLRTGNPEVRLARGVDEETAMRNLFDQGLGAFVRTRQELDREAIVAVRMDQAAVERLDRCGVKVGQSESVLFEIEGVGKV